MRDTENGLLFAPCEPDYLARQLRRWLNDPDLLPVSRANVSQEKSMLQEMDERDENYGIVAGDVRAWLVELSR